MMAWHKPCSHRVLSPQACLICVQSSAPSVWAKQGLCSPELPCGELPSTIWTGTFFLWGDQKILYTKVLLLCCGNLEAWTIPLHMLLGAGHLDSTSVDVNEKCSIDFKENWIRSLKTSPWLILKGQWEWTASDVAFPCNLIPFFSL